MPLIRRLLPPSRSANERLQGQKCFNFYKFDGTAVAQNCVPLLSAVACCIIQHHAMSIKVPDSLSYPFISFCPKDTFPISLSIYMVSRIVGKNERNVFFQMQCSGSQRMTIAPVEGAVTNLEHNPGKCGCGCCRSFEKIFQVLYHTGTSPELRAQGAKVLDRCYLELLEASHGLRAQASGEAPAPGASGVGESPVKEGGLGQQAAASEGAGAAPVESKVVLPPLPRPAKRLKKDDLHAEKVTKEPASEEEEKESREERSERSRSVREEKKKHKRRKESRKEEQARRFVPSPKRREELNSGRFGTKVIAQTFECTGPKS